MFLQNLYNDMLATDNFPDDMKCANLTPVFRNKDLFKKENYRPVSFPSAISKIFEKTRAKPNHRLHRTFFVSIFMWL